jgi:squalene cyclase
VSSPNDESSPRPEIRLAPAIRAALAFLLEGQDEDGTWSDFALTVGASDEWVSGHVGLGLASVAATDLASDELAHALARAERVLRARRHPGGGWGFNAVAGVDSDSTATVLRFLIKRGAAPAREAAGDAAVLLAAQDSGSGGVGTFAWETVRREASAGNPHFPLPASSKFFYRGWCSPDAYVTAMALLAWHAAPGTAPDTAIESGREFLRSAQTSEGHWHGYWAAGTLLPSVVTLEALAAFPGEGRAIARAADWIRRVQSPQGGWSDGVAADITAMDTALAVTGLLAAGAPASDVAVGHAVAWLLAHQAADGSWPAYAHMRVPVCTLERPWESWKEGESGNTERDARRLYTTATVLTALARCYERNASPDARSLT